MERHQSGQNILTKHMRLNTLSSAVAQRVAQEDANVIKCPYRVHNCVHVLVSALEKLDK